MLLDSAEVAGDEVDGLVVEGVPGWGSVCALVEVVELEKEVASV